jgi:hypothetical protein
MALPVGLPSSADGGMWNVLISDVRYDNHQGRLRTVGSTLNMVQQYQSL